MTQFDDDTATEAVPIDELVRAKLKEEEQLRKARIQRVLEKLKSEEW